MKCIEFTGKALCTVLVYRFVLSEPRAELVILSPSGSGEGGPQIPSTFIFCSGSFPLRKRNHMKSLVGLFRYTVEFLVIVFYCPRPTALPKAFLSYIIPSYWVVSLVALRHRLLGLDYSATIWYRLGFFLLFKFGGCSCNRPP